jgi:hypothetical protein
LVSAARETLVTTSGLSWVLCNRPVVALC